MDITIYLPDELGKRAKAEGINLSRTLRAALAHELPRRDAMTDTLKDIETYELGLLDHEGHPYSGRVTGKHIASDESQYATVYLTDDGRVILYDERAQKHWVLEDPEADLQSLPPAEYTAAMDALGIKAVIDL